MPQKPLYNEPELLMLISGGDEKAFGTVFEYYWPVMYANVLQFTKEPELAKDLAQDIFYKVWAMRERLSDIREFRAFLYSVARNLVVDTLRKRVLSAGNEDYLLHYLEDAAALPDHQLEMKELESGIRAAIAQLPEQVGIAFTLKRIEGLSHEEIGRRMQISPVTSRSYITRAVNAIRISLEKKKGLISWLALSAGTWQAGKLFF